MRIALCQINATVAAFDENSARIIDYSQMAHTQGADIALFPEMSLCGYLHLDLAFRDDFIDAGEHALHKLIAMLPPTLYVAVGHIARDRTMPHRLRNMMTVIHQNRIYFQQAKRILPHYDIFDEQRYFVPADHSELCIIAGTRIGFAICEDMWSASADYHHAKHEGINVIDQLVAAGAELIAIVSASPYEYGKPQRRIELLQAISRMYAVPAVYVNGAHSEDGIIFDGRSFVVDRDGALMALCAPYCEEMRVQSVGSHSGGAMRIPESDQQHIEQALHFGLQEFMAKTGYTRVVFGLSGGIDSALVAALAAGALGAENVHCLIMPSRFTSQQSMDDALTVVNNINISYTILPIDSANDQILDTLKPLFDGHAPDTSEENIQARIRGMLLMAYSNKFGALTLATGNKSEFATGYATLYGDMCGALALIGDLYKSGVYELAEYVRARDQSIPQSIIDKEPSAELRPHQRDRDSLPPYHLLDAILYRYLELSYSMRALLDEGYDEHMVRDVIRRVHHSEYKRHQAPPVVRLSSKAFGIGRRIIQCRAHYE